MNNKKIASLVLSAIVAWMVVSASSADFNWENFLFDKTEMKQHFQKGVNGWMKWLTDDEKNQVESMTDEDKKAFLETKKAERNVEREAKQAERQVHEKVIDKLLEGESLTADEETLRAEIIEKRAERKIEREAKELERAEMKSIMEKKRAWEDLTEDEEAKLDEMKSQFKWKKWGKKGDRKWGNDRGYFRMDK